jgi:hypothetical protein
MSAPQSRGRIHPAKVRWDVCATLVFRPCDVPKGHAAQASSIQLAREKTSGDWHIDQDIKCGAGAQGRPKPVTEKYNWCSVKRESLGRVPWLQGEPIPDSAYVPASSYELIMTNWSGKRSFPF